MAPKLAIDIHADGADLTTALINFTGSGANTVIAGVAGQLIRVYRLYFVVTSATVITFLDGTTAFSGPLNFLDNGTMVLNFDTKPWFTTSSGNDFVLNSTKIGRAHV